MAGITDSKLSAVIPQHAPPPGLRPAVVAHLGKGGVPPVASLPGPPLAATETVPVSAPSAIVPIVRKRIEKRKNGSPSLPEKLEDWRRVFSIRLSPEEHHAIEAKARASGLSIASYLRACALGTTGPRARRSPSVNAELLAHAVAALNRVGSNVNQIAHVLNAGQSVGAAEAVSTLAEIRAVLAQIRAAVARTDRA